MASDVDGYRFDLRLGYDQEVLLQLHLVSHEATDLLDCFAEMDRLQVDYIIRF